jgi:hypothetical protein
MTRPTAQRHARLRFFAVCETQTAYAVDYYPEERARTVRQLGRTVIGEFATHEAAFAFAFDELKRRARQAFPKPARLTGDR